MPGYIPGASATGPAPDPPPTRPARPGAATWGRQTRDLASLRPPAPRGPGCGGACSHPPSGLRKGTPEGDAPLDDGSSAYFHQPKEPEFPGRVPNKPYYIHFSDLMPHRFPQ
ncbi:hypothetical protein H8959_003953 [Pygathrix nigripes]